MPKPAVNHTVSLRLSSDMYRRTTELARRRNKSVNALLQEGVCRLLQDEEDRTLSDAFDLLARHPADTDVEYAIHAQSEVILGDES